MITGAEINNKVDVEKEHVFIAFSVEQVRDELDYAWAFDSDNPNRLGDHTVIVSDLWIQDAIEDAIENFSYEYVFLHLIHHKFFESQVLFYNCTK